MNRARLRLLDATLRKVYILAAGELYGPEWDEFEASVDATQMEIDSLRARTKQAEAERAAAAERCARLRYWLDTLPDPHLSACAIHTEQRWEACDCACREAMADEPPKERPL